MALQLHEGIDRHAPAEPPGTVAARGAVEPLEQVVEEWRALGAQAGGPIEQPEWAQACLDASREGGRLRIVAVRRGSDLVAIAPMMVRPIHGVARTIMLGVDEQHEPMNLLAADPEALATLARSLAAGPRPSVFGRLPAGSPSVTALRAAFRGRGLVVARSRAPYPYITLDDSWIEPESHLSARRRSDLRRATRRAEELGAVRFEILSPGPRDVDAVLDEALAVEARSWKGLSGTAMAFDAGEQTLIRSFARGASERGSLRIGFLRIDERAVAMQIAAVQGDAFWLLKIGYDGEFARCSPGVLMLQASIAHAAREGLATFEFLGRSEPWIAVWTDRERPTVCLSAYPLGPRGAVALVADTLEWAARYAGGRATALKPRAKASVIAAAAPVLGRLARRYIAGPTMADAQEAVGRVASHGMTATIGFWDGPGSRPREVADAYLDALDALAADRRDTVLAIKLPALGHQPDLVSEIAARAVATGRRIHVDSLSPESAVETEGLVVGAQEAHPGLEVGVTLPGRWHRSLDDASWVCRRHLPVRVVKGEWPDPDDPDRDMRAGFLEVIDRLAGSAAHVGVATHDSALAVEAIRRLRSAGTPCGLELLYGLPMRDALRHARELGLGIRTYVPYGHAYMPYALGQVRRKPRMALWIARDLVATAAASSRTALSRLRISAR